MADREVEVPAVEANCGRRFGIVTDVEANRPDRSVGSEAEPDRIAPTRLRDVGNAAEDVSDIVERRAGDEPEDREPQLHISYYETVSSQRDRTAFRVWAPELVNQDPHGQGWIIRLKVADKSEVDGLMNSLEYEKYLEGLDK